MHRPRSLSGMQPTSDSLHLGNYIGALGEWVRLQETHDAFYFVADLHALTVSPDPAVLRERTRLTAAQFIAGGVDPARSVLFVQSHIAQHTELSWVLSCLTGFGEAGRMTQFKDKSAKGAGPTSGSSPTRCCRPPTSSSTTPTSCPVGEDQRQHLELSRDLAGRFNARFGDTLVVPEPHIMKATAKIQDLQDPTAKMSKSAATERPHQPARRPGPHRKKIRSAVTDTEREIRFDPDAKPGVSNLLSIHAALSGTSVAELEAAYEGKGYGDLKKDVAEVVVAAVTRSASAPSSSWPTARSSTGSSRTAPSAPARWPRRPCAVCTTGWDCSQLSAGGRADEGWTHASPNLGGSVRGG